MGVRRNGQWPVGTSPLGWQDADLRAKIALLFPCRMATKREHLQAGIAALEFAPRSAMR
jgi:hypothetical protein